MKEHTDLIVRILKHFDLYHTSDEVLSFLLKYPHRGSLKSIEQALKHFNIDCSLIRVKPQKQQLLLQLETPFIVHIKENGNKLLFVKSFKDSIVSCYPDNNRIKKYDLEDFFSKFAGNVLVPYKPTKKSLKQGSTHILRHINKFAFYLLLLLCFIYSIYFFQSPLISILFLLKLVGFGLSLFLLYSEYNPENTFLNTTCRILGGNCSEIVKKTNNRSFLIFSWAELGCIYFLTGSLIIFSGFPIHKGIFLFLLFLNIPTLFFIPYSLYYQKFIKKSWCYFCLTVLFIFVIELLVLLNLDSIGVIPESNSIILFSMISLFSFILIQKEKSSLKSNQLIKNVLSKLGHTIYSSEIINKIQSNSMPISMPEGIGFDIFGDSSSATKQIILVISPFCSPCRKAYHELDKLMLDSRKEDIKVSIVLSIDVTAEKGSENYNVCKEIVLYFLHTRGVKDSFKEIFKHWFIKQKPISDFPNSYKSSSSAILEEVDKILISQRKWIECNHISYTPSILLDGFLLPKGYSVEDLEFML